MKIKFENEEELSNRADKTSESVSTAEAKMKELFDRALEESCRQWCEFIEDAPERKDGEGFADFFYEILEQKEQEWKEEN